MQPGPVRRAVFARDLLFVAFTLAAATTLVTAADTTAATLECPGCDDLNACTVDSCDTTTGTCRHVALDCDDGNPCTQDGCTSYIYDYGASGGCFHSPLTGTTCDDANPCTLGESCYAGQCLPGQFLPDGNACDDGDSCTVNDACDANHHCLGNPLPEGTACDDGNACTSDDRCTSAAGAAPRCAGTARACEDSDPCSLDLCDPATGQCLHPPKDCNDGNACTSDACDPATGACLRDNVAGTCSDGNFCTTGDSCVGGNCIPTGHFSCDDGIACTIDSACRLEGPPCRHEGSACCPPETTCTFSYWDSNQNRCVTVDKQGDCTAPGSCMLSQCVRGGCQGVFMIPCDDGNPCTDDTCPNKACAHTLKADGTACSPPNRCLGMGTCQAGVCTTSTVSCDDHNPCTTDACVDPAIGCSHTPLTGGACDDTNACTAGTTCMQGQCVGGLPVSCDDANPCTLDACDPVGGCAHLVQERPATCGVGTCERTVDTCAGGEYHDCTPGDPAPEICNGLDDDCDNLVDENGLTAQCVVHPFLLFVPPAATALTVTCTLHDQCHGGMVLPPGGAAIDRAWISAADRLFSATDNKPLPDPATVACPDPVQGYGFEPGLVEDVSHRILDATTVTFAFDAAWDGSCLSQEGDRTNLAALLSNLPNGALARVCVASRFNNMPFQGCGPIWLFRR